MLTPYIIVHIVKTGMRRTLSRFLNQRDIFDTNCEQVFVVLEADEPSALEGHLPVLPTIDSGHTVAILTFDPPSGAVLAAAVAAGRIILSRML